MPARSGPQRMTFVSTGGDSDFAPDFWRRVRVTSVPSICFLRRISLGIPSERSNQEEGYVNR